MNHNTRLTLPSPETVETVTQIFKALGDPSRLRIVHLLSGEECSVGRLAELLDMSPSAVSHQLSLLRALRLVKYRRDGKVLYYSCDDEHVISMLQQSIDHVQHT